VRVRATARLPAVTVLVIGASSRVGADVARDLVARGVAVRAMTRRPEATMPEGAEVVRADLDAPASLSDACAGVQRLFLMSSPTSEQVRLETNAIDAAEAAGVEHIVKISNIPVPGLDSGLHGNHRAIEARLAASAIASTVLQPSFFSSVLARQLPLIRRGRFVMPTGNGRVAWIDPRDIAAVAAAVLADREPPAGAFRLTGPEALSGADVAARIAALAGRTVSLLQPPIESWQADLRSNGMDPWLVDSTVHLYEAVARDALAELSPNVERLAGRAPRPLDDWIRDELVPLLRD
jgi:NAD(P)H dehydrogenase (quinone)